MELTARKKQILKIVVESYIDTAEPLGSKAIAQRMPEKVSSATVRNELAGWFGDAYDKIEVAATFNLILNAANMVKNGVGAALCFDLDNISDALTFVPLSPKLETGTVLAWKKDQACSPAAEQFLGCIKNTL